MAADLIGIASAGGRVYSTRRAALDAFPAVTVTTGDEAIDDEERTLNGLERRELEVVIECYASAATGVENALDAMAVEVEEALTDNTLGGVSHALDLTQTSPTSWENDANEQYASLRLTYLVVYATMKNAPTVPI